MSQPTPGIGFSPSTPAAPSGNQNAVPQSNNATPQQAVSFYVPPATDSLLGVVQPDNDTITINEDGVISVVAGGATAAEVQQQAFTYAADTGSANAYAVSLSPTPSLVAGSVVVFKAANANTGASTLAVNGGSAIAITKSGTTALAGGEISTGQIVTVVYDGTEFQIVGGSGSGGGSVYFGQGYGTATTGQNVATLGSTPLAGSVSVFVNGTLLAPNTYTISGAVISLVSGSFGSGNLVVVNWATSNSTPGGITLGGGFLRGTGIGTTAVANITIALPAASESGDLAILFLGSQNGISTPPSGWTQLHYETTSSYWCGSAFSKVLTSGDISAGSVTIDTAGTGGQVAAIAVFVGGMGGVREIDYNGVGSGSSATYSTTTSGSVAATDYAIFFGSNRGGANPSVNVGSEQQAATTGSAAAGCLYAEALSVAGAFTATFSYSDYDPNGYWQAIVIVEA